MMNNKIPCIVLAYYNFDVIRDTLDFLVKDSRLSIYVVENKSDSTDTLIKPYIVGLEKQKLINKYICFDKNISNNAYEVFFDANLIDEKHKYLIVTDGDMIVNPIQNIPDWLDEQISIIENNNDIESCGINLSSENLPRDNPFFTQNDNPIYNCDSWIPDSFGKIHDDCVEADTGVHLWLCKRKIFDEFIALRKKNEWRFLDENLRNFIKNKGLRWVITKKNYCLHLTWGVYNEATHPYTILKMTPDFYKFWKHFDYSFYTLYQNGRHTRKYPYKAIKAFIKKTFLQKKLSKL